MSLSVTEIPLMDVHTASPLGRVFFTEGLGKWGAATTEKKFYRRLLDDEVAELARRTDAHLVVSVMAADERAAWSMQRLPLVLGAFGIAFAEHPIRIVGGADGDSVVRAAFAVRAALVRGQCVVIMGRGRRGRAVRVAMAVMLALGVSVYDAARVVGSAVEGTSVPDLVADGNRVLPAVLDAFVDICVPHRFSRTPHSRALAALGALTASSRPLGHLALVFAETLARNTSFNLRHLASSFHRASSVDGASGIADSRLWSAWLERVHGDSPVGAPMMALSDGDVDEPSLVALMAAQLPIAYLCYDDPERLSDLATLSARLVSWNRAVAIAARWTAELFASALNHRPAVLPSELATVQLERLRTYPGFEGASVTASLLNRFLQDASVVLDDGSSAWDVAAPYAPILDALHHAIWRPTRTWWQEHGVQHAPAVLDRIGALERRRNVAPPVVASSSSEAMGVFACLHDLGYEGLRNASYFKSGVMSVRFAFATEEDFQDMRRRAFARAQHFIQAITANTVDPREDVLDVVFNYMASTTADPAVRSYPITWGASRIAESIASHPLLTERFRACAVADVDHVAWYRRVLDVAGTRGVLMYDFDESDFDFDGGPGQSRKEPLPHVIRYPFSSVQLELGGRRWVRAGSPTADG